jgi:hypothetical protein
MKSLLKSMLPKKRKDGEDDHDFDWREEGISSLVRLIVLGWTGAILTLNYVSIPGIPQQKIDPTFIASVFTGTLATFGVTPSKSNGNGNGNGNNKSVETSRKKEEESAK